MVPAGAGQNLGVQLGLPQDGQLLALSVVVEAGKADKRCVARRYRGDNLFDEVSPLPDEDDLTQLLGVARRPA